MLVIPRGSGNDFARALNLRSAKDAAEAWRQFVSGSGNVRSVDIGALKACQPNGTCWQEHFFCTVAGVGIDGEVARRANHLPRWLRANGGYVFALLPTIFRFAPFPLKIVTDETASASSFPPTILAALANVPAYGGGMKIAPQAKLDDGRLDVCVIRDINKFKLFCVFPTIYFGRHLGLTEFEYSQAASARVETEYPLDVYADGEYVLPDADRCLSAAQRVASHRSAACLPHITNSQSLRLTAHERSARVECFVSLSTGMVSGHSYVSRQSAAYRCVSGRGCS